MNRESRKQPKVPRWACRRGYMNNWRRMPQRPKQESQIPIEGVCRPRPPVKERMVQCALGDVGVERKRGKMCINAALWRGRRPKETSVTRTSRVQIFLKGGRGGCGGPGLDDGGEGFISISSEVGRSSIFMAV